MLAGGHWRVRSLLLPPPLFPLPVGGHFVMVWGGAKFTRDVPIRQKLHSLFSTSYFHLPGAILTPTWANVGVVFDNFLASKLASHPQAILDSILALLWTLPKWIQMYYLQYFVAIGLLKLSINFGSGAISEPHEPSS